MELKNFEGLSTFKFYNQRAINNELRPCYYGKEKGLFHCWEHYSKPIEASPLVGGTPAGCFSQIFGLVENENGEIVRVEPFKIRFIDDMINSYGFLIKGETDGED